MGNPSAESSGTPCPGDQRFGPVRDLLTQAVADGAFPGAAFAVMRAGSLLAVGSVGRFTYAEESPLVEPGTSFDLASVSKVLATAAMAMLLWQRGVLELDARLADILPGFLIAGEKDDAFRRSRRLVSLRMLLAHSSGLPAYAPFYETASTADQLMRAALALPLVADPGTVEAYSDPGFILLGKALEVLARESLDSFCRRNIFEPLGLAGTRYQPGASTRTAIPPTEVDATFRHRVIQGEVHDENCFVLGGVSGHAGLFAPAIDVACFGEAMLQPLRHRAAIDKAAPGQGSRPWPGNRFAGAASVFTYDAIRLFTRRADVPPGSSRALGWDTPSGELSSAGTRFSARSFGHLGFTGTSLWVDPDQDLSVGLLTNRTFPTRQNRKIQLVRPHFYDTLVECIEMG